MAWEPPSNKLEFADIGNALLKGAHTNYYDANADKIRAEEEGRKTVAGDLPAAVGGDQAAIGRVAQHAPDLLGKLAPMLGRLDAHNLARVKASADLSFRVANAVLQADPKDQPAMYQRGLEEMRANGHDVSKLPPAWDASVPALLRYNRQLGQQANEFFKAQDDLERKKTAPGKAGGGGGGFMPFSWEKPAGAPGRQSSSVAPDVLNGGFAPPDVRQATAMPEPQPVAAPVQQASAAPPGFKAVGHKQPDGSVKEAMIDGRPVYRNLQTGELTSNVQTAAAPPIAEGTGEPIQQGDGGPPGSPAGNGPQMAQVAPPAKVTPTPSAPGVVVHEVPAGYEPRYTSDGHPVVDPKTGYIPLYTQGNSRALLLKPADQKPEKVTKRLEDVFGPDGKTLIGQRNPDTNEYKPISVDAGNRHLSNSERDDLAKTGGVLEMAELVKSFRPDYGGYMAEPLGRAANMYQRNAPESMGGGDPTGQAQWWQRYAAMSNIERNKLFGATLTVGEQQAWKEATVNPGMQPEQIRENLQRQSDIAGKALSRVVNSMVKSGYNKEAIEAAVGVRVGDLPDPIGGVPQAAPRGTRPPLSAFEKKR